VKQNYRQLTVAILGAGTVGAQVAHRLLTQRAELASRIGAELEVVGIAVRSLGANRSVELPQELLTTDAESLVVRADIVVELMGGIEPARTLILRALESGADVITANKALLAAHGPELFDAADKVGAQLNYEAAVAGAIPIIRPLRDSLAGDQVKRILGIVNGTTNFILDLMDTEGQSMEQALATATDLGYAEADPTADIEGYDAAQKAALLAQLAFHTTVDVDRVYREGITKITLDQVRQARQHGSVVKLLAICERVRAKDGEEGVSVRVHPTLVPLSHPLASVHGANNAVFVEAEAAGSLMFYGAGAGGPETASAVLGDIVSAARRHVVGGPGVAESTHANLPMVDVGSIDTRYHIWLEVSDQPGVLAEIARIFADHQVSVETVQQSRQPSHDGGAPTATLVIQTHKAPGSALDNTVSALQVSSAVSAVSGVIRVEGE
jgi:homoserine dehydrogenase